MVMGLYLASLQSYLLFHSLAETFSVVVAAGIFMVAWNARAFLQTGYFVVLGISFLSVASLDLTHMLAYSGMGVFPQHSVDLPTQLWIAARYVQSTSFLVAPFFLDRAVKPLRVFAAYGGITALFFAAIFYWQGFPACFVPGTGLTPFKIGSEYAICLIFVSGGVLLWVKRRLVDREILGLLLGSTAIMVASELAFTLYASPFGLPNLVGHLLKTGAFLLIYMALIEVGLSKPYRLLFRTLKRNEEELSDSRRQLELANTQLRDSVRLLEEDESAARQLQFDLLPPARASFAGYEFTRFLRTSTLLSGDFVDYFEIDKGHVGFYMADVSGHGASSALVTVLLKSTMTHRLQACRLGHDQLVLHPELVLQWLNEYLLRQCVEKYLTLFYGILDVTANSLLFSNGGHFPYPILADSRGTRLIEQKSLPLGLFEDAEYRACEIALPPTFTLALFSDGVFDVLRHGSLDSKREFLVAEVARSDVTLGRLVNDLELMAATAPNDDVTILLLRKDTES